MRHAAACQRRLLLCYWLALLACTTFTQAVDSYST